MAWMPFMVSNAWPELAAMYRDLFSNGWSYLPSHYSTARTVRFQISNFFYITASLLCTNTLNLCKYPFTCDHFCLHNNRLSMT